MKNVNENLKNKKEIKEKERHEGSLKACHGVLGDASWTKPYYVVKSDIPNRKDQNND